MRRRGLIGVCLAAALTLLAGGAQAAPSDLDLVSRASGAGGATSSGHSYAPSLSGDGRFVAFESEASNLSPDDGDVNFDVYVRDMLTKGTTLVSRASGASGAKANLDAEDAAISGDGGLVAFESEASNLSPDDGDVNLDVYVRDLRTNTTTLVSRASGATGAKGDGDSQLQAISATGRFVAFFSDATNLSADDGDTTDDVYVRDLQTNTTTLVSRAGGATGAKGNDHSFDASLSGDGRLVAFYSRASNLSPDDGDANRDVFVRDLQTNTTTLVSRAAGASGSKGNADSFAPALSADGRYVAFTSWASNLSPDDSDAVYDAYVRDLQTNTTTLVSRAGGTSGAKGNGGSEAARTAVSAHGRFVAFDSAATNLDPVDRDAVYDAYVRDLQTNTTTLVSRAAGASGAKANADSLSAVLSGDGRFVAFASNATNLHPDDGDAVRDVFRRELANTDNGSPAAAGDAYTTAADTALAIAAPGVLANDSDPDGDPLIAQVVSGPAHGTLSLSADGSFTYTPAGGYSGPESFAYKASDGGLGSNATTVAITVNGLPPPPAAPPAPPAPPPPASAPPPATKPLCQGRPATIVGTAGNDVLHGTKRADVIVALAGNDRIKGGGGADLVCAGAGNDRAEGAAGNDRLYGQAGNDLLLGGPGKDRLWGGPGKDRTNGGPGHDRSFS